MTFEDWLMSKVLLGNKETTVLGRLSHLVFVNQGIQITGFGPGYGLTAPEAMELVRLEGMLDAWSLAEDWSDAKVKELWKRIEMEIVRQQVAKRPQIILPN